MFSRNGELSSAWQTSEPIELEDSVLNSEQCQNPCSCTRLAAAEFSRTPSLCLTDDSAIADCFDDFDTHDEFETPQLAQDPGRATGRMQATEPPQMLDGAATVAKASYDSKSNILNCYFKDDGEDQPPSESTEDQKCSVDGIQLQNIKDESLYPKKVAIQQTDNAPTEEMSSEIRKSPVKRQRHGYFLRATEKVDYSTIIACFSQQKAMKTESSAEKNRKVRKRKRQRAKETVIITNKFRGIKMMLVDLGRKCPVQSVQIFNNNDHELSLPGGPHVSSSPCVLAKCKPRKAKKEEDFPEELIVKWPHKKPAEKSYDLKEDAAALEAYLSAPSLISDKENTVEQFYHALHRLRRTNEAFCKKKVYLALTTVREAEVVTQSRQKEIVPSTQHAEEEERVCTFCDMYIAVSAMQQHMISVHKHRCHFPRCKQWFSSKSLLDQHRLSNHADQLHICVLCEKYFHSKRILLSHLQTKCHQRSDRVFQIAVSLLTSGKRLSHSLVDEPPTEKPSYLDNLRVSSEAHPDLPGVIISIPDDSSPASPEEDLDSGMLEEFAESLRDIDLNPMSTETPVVDFDWLYLDDNV